MKTLYTKDAERTGISRFPNFHKTGSITGMKELYLSLIHILYFHFGEEKRREEIKANCVRKVKPHIKRI